MLISVTPGFLFFFFCPNKFNAKSIPPGLAVLLTLKSQVLPCAVKASLATLKSVLSNPWGGTEALWLIHWDEISHRSSSRPGISVLWSDSEHDSSLSPQGLGWQVWATTPGWSQHSQDLSKCLCLALPLRSGQMFCLGFFFSSLDEGWYKLVIASFNESEHVISKC